ncbi:hypothetical protein WOLCODRAFT_135369 [Wolfiporia cocos MD-104 SS10]|uniref:Tethering factor for nuclear proteasome STS1 n=1 Tax=Wolfiporia cocos (strain MD-104) TaxID=742152 RepID=A0A2H3IV57_WOLCO|nr:hypothetical protein WOLCODRAFT_135369 [Wolfiporia cocos MD-104 SS10]
MANVVTHPQLQVDFHRGPLHHSPSPLGFGFGLSNTPVMGGWSATPSHALQPSWPAATSSQHSASRPAKRRHEPDDDSDLRGTRDESMESNSPPPERPKRSAPKRARTTPALVVTGKEEKNSKENKPPPASDENDVDVGVLLASLPPQSLLPLLTSLLAAQPSLKSTVLSLIPRPTLDTAMQALAVSANKLRDAYPYSTSPFSQPGPSYSPGFGMGSFASNRAGSPSPAGFGFGRPSAVSAFSSTPSQPPNNGMRDEYIINRMRPHITEFVSACLSYLPYFSYAAPPSSSPSQKLHTQSHAAALQLQHKDRSHPTETYLFLSALTTHVLNQPPLAQASLAPLLLPRLTDEWRAWIDRVDQLVNREGGMFGSETVRSWERGLDELAQAKGNGFEVFRQLRDMWVSKVGWLLGRQAMEEL